MQAEWLDSRLADGRARQQRVHAAVPRHVEKRKRRPADRPYQAANAANREATEQLFMRQFKRTADPGKVLIPSHASGGVTAEKCWVYFDILISSLAFRPFDLVHTLDSFSSDCRLL